MRISLLNALVLLLAIPAAAQQITRHELGVGFGYNTNTANSDSALVESATHPVRYAYRAPQLRYSFNVNRNIALESTFAPNIYHTVDSLREGGRQTLILGGIKAGIRRGRFGFFGTSAAGAASFQCGEHEIYPADQCTRETHFALQQGAAIEYALSPRTAFRFDAGELLTAQFRRVYESGPSFEVTSFSAIPHHFVFNLSATRRFGRLEALPSEPDRAPRLNFSAGGLYLMNLQEHLLLSEVRATGGGGAWIGFPLLPGRAGRYLSADLVAYDQPHDDHTANTQDGGTIFSAFVGPKLGFRKGRFALFAKARPGITRFSRTDTLDVASPIYGVVSHDHPKIDFALDTGLVAEYVPLSSIRHLQPVLRFEGGSTYIHYHGATTTVIEDLNGAQTPLNFYSPPQRHTTLTFLTGLGFRF